MAYRNSLQADALKLVAKKLQSSLAVEGELPEDGLAAYGNEGDELMMALARKIVSGEEADAEATAEEYLLDDGWKVFEVEPEAAPVNGHHAAVEVNGNGHREEALEPQQTLFSWAEFMALKPVKPKGRGRNPIPVRLGAYS